MVTYGCDELKESKNFYNLQYSDTTVKIEAEKGFMLVYVSFCLADSFVFCFWKIDSKSLWKYTGKFRVRYSLAAIWDCNFLFLAGK